jgi:sulfur carrier protein
MIIVNGEQADHEEGMTVASLLEKKKFVFPMLVVRINGRLVEREKYDRTTIADNDVVDVIHLISGG